MSSVRTAAARSLWWSIVETGGLAALAFVSLVVLARLLTPTEFGLAALALGIVQMLDIVIVGLFGDAIVQRPNLERRHVASAFWVTLVLGATFSAICWLGAAPLASVFGEPRFAPVLGWMSVGLVFSGADAILTAQRRRELDFRVLALRSLISRVGAAAVGVGAALLGYGVWSLVAQQLAAGAMSATLLWLCTPVKPRLCLDVRAVRDLARFGIAVAASDLIWASNLRIFTIVVGLLLPASQVGYLHLAFRFVYTARDFLASGADHVALAAFSKRQHERAVLRRSYLEANEFVCVFMMPAFAGLALVAPEFVVIVAGAQWAPAAPLVQVLSISFVLYSGRTLTPAVLCAVGRPDLMVYSNIAAFVASLGALALFMSTSSLGAAIAWAMRPVVALPLGLIFVRQAAGIGIGAQLAKIVAPAAATLTMSLGVLLLRSHLPAEWGSTYVFLAVVSSGIILYLIALLAIRPSLLRGVVSFLAAGLRRQPMADQFSSARTARR
ncbi:MAG TPA: lipopolysaccharide biosynthesis protein [Alphaproteobacteria bacterium]